jgi:hypothetical protein
MDEDISSPFTLIIAFRSIPLDYNAALTNARVALEALAEDVAAEVAG